MIGNPEITMPEFRCTIRLLDTVISSATANSRQLSKRLACSAALKWCKENEARVKKLLEQLLETFETQEEEDKRAKGETVSSHNAQESLDQDQTPTGSQMKSSAVEYNDIGMKEGPFDGDDDDADTGEANTDVESIFSDMTMILEGAVEDSHPITKSDESVQEVVDESKLRQEQEQRWKDEISSYLI
jgi:hypothetical protein